MTYTETPSVVRGGIVPVVFDCDVCGSYQHVAVLFRDGEAPHVRLPEECPGCRHPLNRPDVRSDAIDSARKIVEAIHAGRL
jgi:hypothetical protein